MSKNLNEIQSSLEPFDSQSVTDPGSSWAPTSQVIEAVADPGFPRAWDTNPPLGHQHTILPNVPKTARNWNNFDPRVHHCYFKNPYHIERALYASLIS